MNKKVLLDWMQDRDEQQARNYRCRILAETLCAMMNISPFARNLVLLLRQVEYRSNVEAIAGWVDGQIGNMEGVSEEELLVFLEHKLIDVLTERLPTS